MSVFSLKGTATSDECSPLESIDAFEMKPLFPRLL
jgi:hypothetical protein